MKSALKFIMTSLGLLLIGINVVVVLLLTQFENYLRDGLTLQAGKIVKSEVHLEAVRVDWAEQALVFKGFSIFNPEGFTDREAVRIESLWVRPDLLTIFSKTPVIQEINLQSAEVHLQYKAASGTNLGAMMEQARAWSEDQAEGEKLVLGRPMRVAHLRSSPVALDVRGIDPPSAEVALALDAFAIDSPNGETPVTGARIIHLILRSIMRQLTTVDTLEAPVRELLLGETELDAA